jgi:hypothetical protein
MPKHVGFHVKGILPEMMGLSEQEALISGMVDSLGLILHAKTCY